MKEIILKHLNKLGTELEESYGDKLILLEGKDFEEFAEKLVKKLTIPAVVHRRELLLASICEYNKFNTQKDIKAVDDWLDKWDSK